MECSSIQINKAGKNCEIKIQTLSGNFTNLMEDSSNVELQYNELNDSVNLNIKGGNSYSVYGLNDGGTLFLEGVDITNYSTFLTQYALVFLNGGSGPGSTPTLQQVLDEGNFADIVNGVANIQLTDSANAVNTYLNPGIINVANDNQQTAEIISESIAIQDTFTNRKIEANINDLKISLENNANGRNTNIYSDSVILFDGANEGKLAQSEYKISNSVYGNYISGDLGTMQMRTIIPGTAGMIIGPDKIQQQDLSSGLQTEITFPKTNNRFIQFPDKNGILSTYTKKIIFYMQYDGANLNITTIFSDGITYNYYQRITDGMYQILFNELYDANKSIIKVGINQDSQAGNFQYDYVILTNNYISGGSISGVGIDSFNHSNLQHRDLISTNLYWVEITEYN